MPSPANRRIAASGLFDACAYLQAYPHAGLGVLSPLDHFMAHGARTGCDPNPYFAVAWYMANNPDVARAGVNPLSHYLETGEREGRAPSRAFDPAYYAARYPDAAASGRGLLAHYLAYGRAEGRLPKAPDPAGDGAPLAGEADIAVVKAASVSPADKVVLLACHAPAGRLRGHAVAYLDALYAAGWKVVAVVAADAPFDAPPGLTARLAGLYVRENAGLDFAAWAHALQLEPSLYAAGALLLANDSMAPATDPARIARLLDRMVAHPGDLVGLTDNYEVEWHVQSYALLLKPAALRTAALQRFMLAVRSLPGKAQVIEAYELRFASAMRSAGLETGVLFAATDKDNPTLKGWRALLDRGFPLVKLAVLQGRDASIEIGDWRATLAAHGFDADLAAEAMAPHVVEVAAGDGLLAPATRHAAQVCSAGRPLTLDYLGPWNFDNGLGAASRGMTSALWRTPFRVNLRSVRRPFHAHGRAAPSVDATDVVEPADVAVAHLNPDGLALMTEDQRRRFARAGLRIGLWVWEMEQLPADWLDRLGEVDAVWAPSRYCVDIFAPALGGRPVHLVPHVVETPPPPEPAEAAAARRAVGAPAGRRLILYAFDGASYLARKNPLALVHAFAASGLAARGWTLVLKTKHLFDAPAAGRALAEAAASTPEVLLINASATAERIHALMAATDIYASPHCAEGFGLTVAEAMAMGKSVIATDYSGPCDFLSADCGYPVAYSLETLAQDHGHYRRGGVWAKVDEAALARALVRAADDLDAGRGPGLRARARIAERFSPEAVARAMQDSLADLTRARA